MTSLLRRIAERFRPQLPSHDAYGDWPALPNDLKPSGCVAFHARRVS